MERLGRGPQGRSDPCTTISDISDNADEIQSLGWGYIKRRFGLVGMSRMREGRESCEVVASESEGCQ